MEEKTILFDDEQEKGDAIIPTHVNTNLADNEEVFSPKSASLFNPNVKVPFQHPTDPDKKIVFFGHYYDNGGGLLTHDTAIIETLLRLKKISELSPEKLKSMSESDFEELFNDDKTIKDLKNNDHYKVLIVAYCSTYPPLSPSEIYETLPRSVWHKLYEIYTGGVSGVNKDVVDMFPVEIEE